VILTEVLQGFRHDRDYQTAKELFTSLTVVEMLGHHLTIRAGDNFPQLRRLDVTVRKTIDITIATGCFENRVSLLYSDRDFDPCCEHLGLRNVLRES
jgi:hypothetical protein